MVQKENCPHRQRIEGKDNWSVALQWLNLVLSILIVFLHVDLSSGHVAYLITKQVTNVLADSAVPAFFCVSAYLLFRKEQSVRYWLLLRKKALSILCPYLLWSVLGCAYQGLLALVKGEAFTISVADVLLAEHNGALWFLRVLFGYVIVTPVISFVVRKRALGLALIVGVAVCNVFVYTFPYSSMMYWLPCYLFGAYCAANHRDFVESDKLQTGMGSKIVPALLMCIVVALGVLVYDSRWYYVYRLAGGLLVVLMFLLQEWKRAPASMLQNSFFTFCSHTFLLGIAKLVNRFLPDNGFVLVVGYVICASATWFATVLIAEMLKNFLPRIYAVFVGGRKNMRT